MRFWLFQWIFLVVVLLPPAPDGAPCEGSHEGLVWDEWLAIQSPLNIEWADEFESEGIMIRRLRYTGSVWKGEPQRVYAIYSHPEGAGPFPTILQIHGGGQTCYPANVAFFVRHGYACLSFDWTGPRDNRPEEEITLWHEDFRGGYMDPEEHLPGQSLVHHAVLAAIRGIDVLCEQPEVDANRIGAQGISWGGYVTWLVGALDTRVRASVPVYGVGGLEKQWSGMAKSLRSRSEEFRNYWRTNYEPASFASLQKGAVMYLDSTNDFFGQLSQAEDRLSDVTVEHRRSYSPNQNHSLDPETVAAGMAWFETHLKENGAFPEEPRLGFAVSENGELEATIHLDPSRQVNGVRLDYARGGRHDLLRCWISKDATPTTDTSWKAVLPLVEAAQPLAVIPQVVYEEGFVLSGAVAEFVPAAEYQNVRASEGTSDILSDWDNGPSGWFLTRGTDFIHADKASPSLNSGTIEGHHALIYEREGPRGQIHLSTRLISDPGRNEGNHRDLEVWTHDLESVEIRTDWQTHQPGVRSYQARFEGGQGWRRTVISLKDLTAMSENPGGAVANTNLLSLWNDVQRIEFLGTPINEGAPAIGLVRWTDSETLNSEN